MTPQETSIAQIKAEVVCDTRWRGQRITSVLIRHPRVIHAELLRHRSFSFQVASSRAVPTLLLLKEVMETPYVPFSWLQNQKGMAGGDDLSPAEQAEATEAWLWGRDQAMALVNRLLLLKSHKQYTNRPLEPYLFFPALITATNWGNFFNLRVHPAAMPEMEALARAVKKAMEESTPIARNYHLPFLKEEEIATPEAIQESVSKLRIPPEIVEQLEARVDPDLMKLLRYETPRNADSLVLLGLISAARCARLSYARLDGNPQDNTFDLTHGLHHLEHGHWSISEHQAFSGSSFPEDRYVSAVTRHIYDRYPRSNFRFPWVQMRKLFINEAVFLGGVP